MGKDTSQSLGLRFDSKDDAFGFAEKVVEDSYRWLSSHNISLAHDYLQGKSEIVE